MKWAAGVNSGRLTPVYSTSAEAGLGAEVFVGHRNGQVTNCLLNRVAAEVCFNVTGDTPSSATSSRVYDSRLKDYQVLDLDKTLHLHRVLNANPMGYGKTVEALQWCLMKGYERILVLCPKSSRTQWRSMVAEWYGAADVSVVPEDDLDQITITNYEQLLRRSDLMAVKWDCVIADEAHRIRNHKSKTAVAMRSLRATARLALTGTPIMNQPDDLFGIMLWLDPTVFGTSYWNFVDMYCNVKEDFWGRKPVGLTESPIRRQVLKATLEKFWIRNPQNMVGKGVQESVVPLDMYTGQAKVYQQVRKLAIDELDKVGISIPNAMTQFMRMQQLTTNPGGFEGLTEANIKFEWIKDLLLDNPELKLCVFSKFKSAIIALNAYLDKNTCVMIHGDISANMRDFNKEKFITDSKTRVIAGTIGAMSESIDGLQKVCHTVVFLDRAWNPEENNQAIGRVVRIGQELVVNVYTLECSGTIDEYIGKINMNKLEAIKELIYRGSV